MLPSTLRIIAGRGGEPPILTHERAARVVAALADAPLQVPQEHVSKGQSPENAQAEAAVKELPHESSDLLDKGVVNDGAEACEQDHFGKSMARGHLLGIFGAEVGAVRVREMASRLEGRSSWCVKETLGRGVAAVGAVGDRAAVEPSEGRSNYSAESVLLPLLDGPPVHQVR